MTPVTVSDVVAERVNTARKRRGWDHERLALECAELGAPELTKNVLRNIEYGRRDDEGRRRRDVTVDELLVLAAALGVPVAGLLLPDPRESSTFRITEKLEASWYTGATWLVGESLLSFEMKARQDAEARVLWGETMNLFEYIRAYQDALGEERLAYRDLIREEVKGGGNAERADMARQLYRGVVMKVYTALARLIEAGVRPPALLDPALARTMREHGYLGAENPAIVEFIQAAIDKGDAEG